MRTVPENLRAHILPFDWDVRLVWGQNAPERAVQIRSIEYLLHLPIWSSQRGVGMRFDLVPHDVLATPTLCPHHYERIYSSDTSYPLDFLDWRGKRWILDGVHRLARCHARSDTLVKIRVHPPESVRNIRQEGG